MYLSRFGVKNYKCLGEIDIPLTPIHVLIGENDAGKTSLLEAMAAYCASSDNNLAQVFPQPWQGRELVLHGSREPRIEFSGQWRTLGTEPAESDISEFRYGFAVDFPQEGQDCETPGDWIELGEKPQKLSPKSSARQTTVRRWKLGKEKEEELHREANILLRVLKSAHKYALDPKLMALPTAGRVQGELRMAPDGYGLPTLLSNLAGSHPERYIEIGNRFCGFFPQYKSARLRPQKVLLRAIFAGAHKHGRGVGNGITFETRGGQIVGAQQASDGAILFLAFLTLAHLPDAPNLLLIEEPENGIYPRRIQEVIELLKTLVNRTEGVRFPQIIMTTHSPYVLSHFEPEEVTFLRRSKDDPDGPVTAWPLRDVPNIEERLGSEFYLGELWYNLSEEELFGEC